MGRIRLERMPGTCPPSGRSDSYLSDGSPSPVRRRPILNTLYDAREGAGAPRAMSRLVGRYAVTTDSCLGSRVRLIYIKAVARGRGYGAWASRLATAAVRGLAPGRGCRCWQQ